DVLLELAGPARVLLDRDDLACELGRLAAGGSAEIERALALARPDREAGQLRRPALRPDPALGERLRIHPLDGVGAGNVGRPARWLAGDGANDRLRRLVLGG